MTEENQKTLADFGLKPGDPVPLDVANKLYRQREHDQSVQTRRLGATIGKVATDGMLEAQGLKVPKKKRGRPTAKKPEQEG